MTYFMTNNKRKRNRFRFPPPTHHPTQPSSTARAGRNFETEDCFATRSLLLASLSNSNNTSNIHRTTPGKKWARFFFFFFHKGGGGRRGNIFFLAASCAPFFVLLRVCNYPQLLESICDFKQIKNEKKRATERREERSERERGGRTRGFSRPHFFLPHFLRRKKKDADLLEHRGLTARPRFFLSRGSSSTETGPSSSLSPRLCPGEKAAQSETRPE